MSRHQFFVATCCCLQLCRRGFFWSRLVVIIPGSCCRDSLILSRPLFIGTDVATTYSLYLMSRQLDVVATFCLLLLLSRPSVCCFCRRDCLMMSRPQVLAIDVAKARCCRDFLSVQLLSRQPNVVATSIHLNLLSRRPGVVTTSFLHYCCRDL